MKFRPCIDIHDGKVKQIVGGSLSDQKNTNPEENFVSEQDAAFYSKLYKSDNIKGGHIIILNSKESNQYDISKEQALFALNNYRGGLQIGGGITDQNAKFFLQQGASHVIVTSFVFKDGKINFDNLKKIFRVTGRDHLVLDLSCRKKDGKYYIVTDRWQKFTDVELTKEVFLDLSKYCDEFLIHAVDVEGKASGIEEDIVKLLGELDGIKATYAGGIASTKDIDKLKELGKDKVDFTVGSALDLFGGKMPYEEIKKYNK